MFLINIYLAVTFTSFPGRRAIGGVSYVHIAWGLPESLVAQRLGYGALLICLSRQCQTRAPPLRRRCMYEQEFGACLCSCRPRLSGLPCPLLRQASLGESGLRRGRAESSRGILTIINSWTQQATSARAPVVPQLLEFGQWASEVDAISITIPHPPGRNRPRPTPSTKPYGAQHREHTLGPRLDGLSERPRLWAGQSRNVLRRAPSGLHCLSHR